jgi:hypothetical protein
VFPDLSFFERVLVKRWEVCVVVGMLMKLGVLGKLAREGFAEHEEF